MKISEVAAAAGCSVRAIRHLHETGAVPEPARTSGNYRDYSAADLAAVLRARALIDAGVAVADIHRPDVLLDLREPVDAAHDTYPWQKARTEPVTRVRFYAGQTALDPVISAGVRERSAHPRRAAFPRNPDLDPPAILKKPLKKLQLNLGGLVAFWNSAAFHRH